MKPRLVCWYSHGAASLMASKIAIEQQPVLYPDHEIVVVSIYLKDEYQEPDRDAAVEAFLGMPILKLTNGKYESSVDKVIEKTRYMVGAYGARCTAELKKAVRKNWQRDNDVHVFGFDVNESRRTDNVLDAEPELDIYTPLIDAKMTKKDCFKIITEAGLSLPMMYQLGYHNNNCIGCLKAQGAGYWNKIRKDFPDAFEKRSRQEELLNVGLVRMSRNKFMREHPEEFQRMCDEWEDRYRTMKVVRKNKETGQKEKADYLVSIIPLRYLPEGAGSHKDLDIGDCGFVCEMKN